MFIQQYPSQMRERSTSRSAGSPAHDTSGQRPTRERSSSISEARDLYTKRSSIFFKRPKSILTTASNDSSTRSIASNSSGSNLSRLSPGGDALPASIEPESTKGRFLFGRGRKNRISGMRAFPTTNDFHRAGPEQGRSNPGKGVRISAPFDFQHIAKIEESQTIGVESSEVFENFRTLSKGHRHAIIAPSLEEEEEEDETDSPVRQRKSPPLRPQRPDDLWDYEPVSAPLPQAEQRYLSATYIDNNRQPLSAEYRGTPLSRRMPTRSSTGLSQSFMNGPGPALDTETGMHTLDSFDEYEPFIPLYDSQPPGWIENRLPLLHTVSPMDTFSDHVRTATFNPPLEQVPEEPEGTILNRLSRDLPRRPSLRHSKSTPIIATRSRSSIDSFIVDNFPLPSTTTRIERPVSQCSKGSDTLGNPLGSLWHETKPKTKARSLGLGEQNNTTEPTWEDYIEYCYEHNAEADCDFDWQESSHFDDNDSEASECWSEQYSPYSSSLHTKREDARSMKSTASHAHSLASDKSDHIPSHSSVPELDYRFSRATSTASLSIATPRDGSLYRASDAPPLPTDLYTMKDVWSTHFANGDQLYNEVMVGRTSVVPDSPQLLDDRPQTILYGGMGFPERQHEALPTLPPSSKTPTSLLERSLKSKANSESSMQLGEAEAAQGPLLATSTRSDQGIVPPPVPRSHAEMHKTDKAWPLDDRIKLPSLPPTSTPRDKDLPSLEKVVQYSKLPTPLKSPTSAKLEDARSFLATPSPKLVPKPKPSPIIEEMSSPKSPIHISFPSIDLPPLTLPNSPPQQTTLSRNRAPSIAERFGPLPSSPKPLEKPGTPDSATSAPEGLGRMGYTLFPSKKPSITSLNGSPLPMPPTSAPMSMSEPSLTRPASRSVSQASSSRSSSRALSIKSKSSKKASANAYQQRFPLGI